MHAWAPPVTPREVARWELCPREPPEPSGGRAEPASVDAMTRLHRRTREFLMIDPPCLPQKNHPGHPALHAGRAGGTNSACILHFTTFRLDSHALLRPVLGLLNHVFALLYPISLPSPWENLRIALLDTDDPVWHTVRDMYVSRNRTPPNRLPRPLTTVNRFARCSSI
jgi:hypothetical protein